MMKSKASKYGSLFAGILVAIAVILSQSLPPAKYADAKAKEKTENKAESNAPEATSTISVSSLPASPGIQLTSQAICLFEVIFSLPQDSHSVRPVDIPLTKFFSTLLSVIISPNAP